MGVQHTASGACDVEIEQIKQQHIQKSLSEGRGNSICCPRDLNAFLEHFNRENRSWNIPVKSVNSKDGELIPQAFRQENYALPKGGEKWSTAVLRFPHNTTLLHKQVQRNLGEMEAPIFVSNEVVFHG